MANSTGTAYGSWKSPITAELIVEEGIRLSQIKLDDDDVYWVEMRPGEAGRNVIVRRSSNGKISNMTAKEFNARTRAHEYGGGSYCVADAEIYFSNDQDGRLYYQGKNGIPSPLSPARNYRFADGTVDTARRQIICVMEDHTNAAEEENSIVCLRLNEQSEPRTLISGNDFYANPIVSHDHKQLAWLTWNHPNMPWDGTELWLADFDEDGSLRNHRKVAGGPEESIFQPEWSPNGTLFFVSDRNGWWNLHSFRNGSIKCLHERQAEFGLPQWVFGMSTYGVISDENLICSFCEGGVWHLGILKTNSGEIEPIPLPFTFIDNVRTTTKHAVFIAGSEVAPNAIVRLDLDTLEFEILKRSAEPKLDSTYFSRPEIIEFPTEDGLTAHGYFYQPQNRDFSGPEDQLPPLIVKSHGGPTGAAEATLELRIQFWTSRGFAVLDVNYGGSTGYGREYRQRLDGKWGIVDVDDCVNGAKFLAGKKYVDGNRVAIAGGSAGGYTTLSALTFRDFFKAGASYYGICDLEALVHDTHKFEARYLERLIGPYPERKDIYRARSPIHVTEKISCPVILMQGLQDKIVPPNQAEMMLQALRKKGLPVAYMPFEGEQHGFRKSENIKRALEAELYFYSKIFGFEIADKIEPIKIENL